MPDRRDVDWLLDILDECDLLTRALDGLTFDAFDRDPILQRAVLHMLQTIGEAANSLSPESLAAMPDTPWPQIRGMRNRIVHGYFGIDLGAVWRTAREEAPVLAAAIRGSGLV
jgi:uncharacterized protein with HEPN domain